MSEGQCVHDIICLQQDCLVTATMEPPPGVWHSPQPKNEAEVFVEMWGRQRALVSSGELEVDKEPDHEEADDDEEMGTSDLSGWIFLRPVVGCVALDKGVVVKYLYNYGKIGDGPPYRVRQPLSVILHVVTVKSVMRDGGTRFIEDEEETKVWNRSTCREATGDKTLDVMWFRKRCYIKNADERLPDHWEMQHEADSEDDVVTDPGV